jgi:hypothetical protein
MTSLKRAPKTTRTRRKRRKKKRRNQPQVPLNDHLVRHRVDLGSGRPPHLEEAASDRTIPLCMGKRAPHLLVQEPHFSLNITRVT